MRLIPTVLLLVFPALSALAQTPDTTSAWRYFPLDIGNVWEYEDWYQDENGDTTFVGYQRFTVVGDTTMPTSIDDGAPVERHYFEVLLERFRADGAPSTPGVTWLRFDTTRAALRESDRVLDYPMTKLGIGGGCPLDGAFSGGGNDVFVMCEGSFLDEPVEAWVLGGYRQPIPVGEGLQGTVKRLSIDFLVSESTWFAADIGMFFQFVSEISSGWSLLVYACIDGVEYGQPFPVATEGAPEPAALAFAVYPNPSRGTTTIRFALDRPQRVTLAVYDVLGRRVLTEDLGGQPTGEMVRRLDVASLPSGVYVVRLDGDAGASATARVVRH